MSDRIVDNPDLFWAKMRRNGECLEWQGDHTMRGYGVLRGPNRTRIYTHRHTYALHHGSVPSTAVVRHTCDNPPCCNPAHLIEGTQRENIHDAVHRGRLARGERSGTRVLTDDKAREIYARAARGESYRSIAADHGVSDVAVLQIAHGRAWGHVTGGTPLQTTRRLTETEQADIVSMFKQGFTFKQIRAHTGRSYVSIRHALKLHGIVLPPGRRSPTQKV